MLRATVDAAVDVVVTEIPSAGRVDPSPAAPAEKNLTVSHALGNLRPQALVLFAVPVSDGATCHELTSLERLPTHW
jgi:hypothetical protein